jgi:hypothetical protein
MALSSTWLVMGITNKLMLGAYDMPSWAKSSDPLFSTIQTWPKLRTLEKNVSLPASKLFLQTFVC